MVDGSLQYLDDRKSAVGRFVRSAGDCFLLTRVPVVERAPTFATIQSVRHEDARPDLRPGGIGGNGDGHRPGIDPGVRRRRPSLREIGPGTAGTSGVALPETGRNPIGKGNPMKPCLICQSPIGAFISFGRMPLANGFLLREEFREEYFFDLDVGFCRKCGMVQLTEQLERERMFHEQYAFFSSTSAFMAHHFKEFAESVVKTLPAGRPLRRRNRQQRRDHAPELRPGRDPPPRHRAVGERRRGRRATGHPHRRRVLRGRLAERSSPNTARPMRSWPRTYVPHPVPARCCAGGVQILLKPNGDLHVRGSVPGRHDREDLLRSDLRRACLLLLRHLRARLFARHGLELVDAVPQDDPRRFDALQRGAQGGQSRLAEAVAAQRTNEQRLGLANRKPTRAFAGNCESSRDRLMALLRDLKRQGQAGRRLRRDVEEHDRDQLLRHHPRPGGVHQRHHADQAGQAARPGPASRSGRTTSSRPGIPTTRCCSPGTTPRKSSPRKMASTRMEEVEPKIFMNVENIS